MKTKQAGKKLRNDFCEENTAYFIFISTSRFRECCL